MVKAFSTLIFRGVVGIVSIATTALITVLVQRYLYEKTGTPPLLFAPPASSTSYPTSSEADQPAPLSLPPDAMKSPAAVETDPVNSEMGVSPEPELDQSELDQSELDQLDQSEIDHVDPFAVPKSADRQPTDRKTQIMEQFWDKLNR